MRLLQITYEQIKKVIEFVAWLLSEVFKKKNKGV